MGDSIETFGKERIGNVRLEFFTSLGSITLEAWRNTRYCKVTTFSSGIRRRTEVKLDGDNWNRFLEPIDCSGFWKWAKRYDSHCFTTYSPSWSFNIMSDAGWYYSSGDGEFPDGFRDMLNSLMRFSSEIEGMDVSPAVKFLSPFADGSKA